MPINPNELPEYVPPQEFFATTERQIDGLIKVNWDAKSRVAKLNAADVARLQKKNKDWYTYEKFLDIFQETYGSVWDIEPVANPSMSDEKNGLAFHDYIMSPKSNIK